MKIRKLSDAYWTGKINWTADASVKGLEGQLLTKGEVIEIPAKDGGGLAVRFNEVRWNGKYTQPIIRLANRPTLQALVDQFEREEEVKAAAQRAQDAELNALPESAFIEGLDVDAGKAFYRKNEDRWLTVVGYKRMKVWNNFEDEWTWDHVAGCRPATEAEKAAAIERSGASEARKTAAAELKTLADEIRKTGEKPSEMNATEGDRVNIGEGQSIYGGGSWFVVGPVWTWFVQNNGADGDDWSFNNVRTGGAGAIGWRVLTTPDLASRIRSLAAAAKVPDA